MERKEYRIVFEINQLPEQEYLRNSVMVRMSVWGGEEPMTYAMMGGKEDEREMECKIAEVIDGMTRMIGSEVIDELEKVNKQ